MKFVDDVKMKQTFLWSEKNQRRQSVMPPLPAPFLLQLASKYRLSVYTDLIPLFTSRLKTTFV